MKASGRDWIRSAAVAAVCAAAVLAAAACGSGGTDGRHTVQTGSGKKLTVMDDPEPAAGHELELSKITKLEEMVGHDWLSGDELLIERIQARPGKAGEEPSFTYTYARRNLTTGQETDWTFGSGFLSPDRKHLFAIATGSDKYDQSGRMIDLTTGVGVDVPLEPGIAVGSWSDSGTLLLDLVMSGKVVAVDTQGNAAPVPMGGEEAESLRAEQRGGALFYLAGDQLKVLREGETEPAVLAGRVHDFRAAPGGERIAYVTNEDGTDTLKLADARGEAIGAPLARSSVVSYYAWSPDGGRLAFCAFSDNQGGMNGIYVLDAASGQVVPLSDMNSVQYEMRWNPQGDKLMVTVGRQHTGEAYPPSDTYVFALGTPYPS